MNEKAKRIQREMYEELTAAERAGDEQRAEVLREQIGEFIADPEAFVRGVERTEAEEAAHSF